MSVAEQLFYGSNLSATVQGIKSGVNTFVPNVLLLPSDVIDGDIAQWDEVDGNRDLANIVSRGSKSKSVGQQGVKRKTVKCIHTFENQVFKDYVFDYMKGVGNVNQSRGEAEIKRQTIWFKQRITNLKQACALQMLGDFALHYDKDGGLLPSSSGAYGSIAVDVPAGQKDQLDILGDGDIISASWATASTDIVLQLANIKTQMLELGGWNVMDAYYGKNIPGYIAKNTTAKEWLNQTPSLATGLALNSNSVPQGFQDFNWIKATTGFWHDSSGTVRKPIGDDEIVFTPSPDNSWWKMFSGSNSVPNKLGNVSSDANSARNDVSQVNGAFSYAAIEHDPVRLVQYVGETFLPVISATKAVCKADVTP